MARTRAADYEQKRGRILDEAARLFAEHGFGGTSVGALARAVGGSKAGFYHYYPSKEALLYELLREHTAGLAALVAEATQVAGTPAERLRRLVRALMRVYVRSADRHVVLLNDLGALPAAQQAEIVEAQRAVTRTVGALVVQLAPHLEGPLRAPATMALMGAINFTYTWFDAEGPVDADTYADLTTRLFLSGVGGLEAER
jgi:AcrR family transcriptional regulator